MAPYIVDAIGYNDKRSWEEAHGTAKAILDAIHRGLVPGVCMAEELVKTETMMGEWWAKSNQMELERAAAIARAERACVVLEENTIQLKAAWQFLDALCKNDGSVDRMAARDRAMAGYQFALKSCRCLSTPEPKADKPCKDQVK
jgi:hypothetical protein